MISIKNSNLYIDEQSLCKWFRHSKDEILLFYVDEEIINKCYCVDGNYTFPDDGLIFDEALISKNFITVRYDAPDEDSFIILNRALECKEDSITVLIGKPSQKNNIKYRRFVDEFTERNSNEKILNK